MPDSSRFGRYEVEEEVARGGMGVIYRVRDPEMRRFLAMKVLLADEGPADDASKSRHSKLSARFTDEAQLTGQLDHPGIIPVYDMGRDDDGRLYFTMRLVKGRTLEEIFELVRDGREGWTVTRAIGVLQKVCEAMGFAHQRGVVHRDLKPANVMVGRFGETYVMDWGLAKIVDEKDAGQPVSHPSPQTVLTSARKDEASRGAGLETLEGDVMGTPAYMALEQARGEVHRVGPRSDVYSVGAMLYHLLSGHPPYRPANDRASGREILDRLYTGPPPAVETQADAPAELCAICERAMGRQPEERYGTMLEVAEDLQAFVENRVVQAYRQGAVVEFKKWVQRNRAIAASLAVIFVLIVAGLGAVSLIQTRARDAVEDKNRELAASNIELEAERKRTTEARDRAERNQALAVENERIARASEEEALWQSYVGNISGAHAALEVGSASEARRRLAACAESLRGWEWRYLNQRADGSLRVLTGSETFLGSLAVNPVSPHVAAAGGMLGSSGAPDFKIRVWDFESGQLEKTLEGHGTSISDLAYSPAGDALASCDIDYNLRIWDVESGELIAEEPDIGRWLAYHPNGRWIVVEDYGRRTLDTPGTVTLWDSYDLVRVASRQLPVASNSVRISPDGQRIALAGIDDHIRILDLNLETLLDLDASGEARASDGLNNTLDIGPGVYCIDFSPDGRRLVSGSGDGFVRTWDLETGQRLEFFRGHRSIVKSVRWHPRFSWIVSSDKTGSIRFWNSETGQPLDVLRGHDEDVTSLGFSALGDRLLSASRDKTVRVWDGQAGANDTSLDGYSYPNFRPYELAFSADAERIAWRSAESTVSVSDVRTGEDVSSIWTDGPSSVACMEFVDGDLWEVSWLGRLTRWSPSTGERLSTVETGLSTWGGVFQPGHRAVLLAGRASSFWLKLVDLNSESVVWTTPVGFRPRTLAFSHDGSRCVVSARPLQGDGGGIVALDASSGTVLWEVWDSGHGTRLAVFPDGERFAHTNYNEWNKSLYIRSLKTGELLKTLIGHAQPTAIDISPDGSRIVSGNWDGTLSLWSPERGEIIVVPAHSMVVPDVGFSPDGQLIASLGSDGRRRIWSATAVESRQVARTAAARRRRWSGDARRRVDDLLETRIHRSAVVEALEGDPGLQPVQREAAIMMAHSDPISVWGLLERSKAIGMSPGHTGAEYMRAMNGAKLATELAPEVPEFFEALGAARIRMGLAYEALTCLDQAERLRAEDGNGFPPALLFLKALAHHQLADVTAAGREYESGLTELRVGGMWTPEAMALGRGLELEARALLGRD